MSRGLHSSPRCDRGEQGLIVWACSAVAPQSCVNNEPRHFNLAQGHRLRGLDPDAPRMPRYCTTAGFSLEKSLKQPLVSILGVLQWKSSFFFTTKTMFNKNQDWWPIFTTTDKLCTGSDPKFGLFLLYLIIKSSWRSSLNNNFWKCPLPCKRATGLAFTLGWNHHQYRWSA